MFSASKKLHKQWRNYFCTYHHTKSKQSFFHPGLCYAYLPILPHSFYELTEPGSMPLTKAGWMFWKIHTKESNDDWALKTLCCVWNAHLTQSIAFWRCFRGHLKVAFLCMGFIMAATHPSPPSHRWCAPEESYEGSNSFKIYDIFNLSSFHVIVWWLGLKWRGSVFSDHSIVIKSNKASCI